MVVFRIFVFTLSSIPATQQQQQQQQHVLPSPSAAPLTSQSSLDEHLARQLIQKQTLHCANTVRPTRIRTRNNWQLYSKNASHEVLVYSAFYDDRPAIGVVPVLQVLAVATTTTAPLYCQLWYDGFPNPAVVLVAVKTTGRDDKILGLWYSQYLYTCVLAAADPVPTHVSLSLSACGTDSSILLPIHVPVRASRPPHEFGACVSISFGAMSWSKLIEWFELTAIFGVTEMNIYN